MPDPIREWIDGMRKYQPISIAIIDRLMQFVDHENSLWGDPNNPATQARADVERILAGEPVPPTSFVRRNCVPGERP